MVQRWLGEKKLPYICTPVTGKTHEEIMEEVTSIVEKQPDVIEWRADFFTNIAEEQAVLAVLRDMYETAGGIPILFTFRSTKEGGQATSLTETERLALISEICASESIALVDYELCNESEHIQQVRHASREHGKGLILSHHNFACTPDKAAILKQLVRAECYGADIAKVSVMPRSKKDVLALLEVTQEGAEVLDIPLLTISMGALGSMSRTMGWMYGSIMTFAVGANSSAPGQIPIDELRQVIEVSKQFSGVE